MVCLGKYQSSRALTSAVPTDPFWKARWRNRLE